MASTAEDLSVAGSACVVPPGSIVLEEGYQNQAQRGASPNVTASFPQGFERFGLAPRLELDAIGPSLNRSRSPGLLATGYGDAGLGFKYELPQSGRFTYAIDGLFTAASGGRGFTAGGPTQTVNLDAAYAVSPAVGFGTTIAGTSAAGFRSEGNAARFGYLVPSFVVTVQVATACQFYAELAGQTKLAPDRGGHLVADAGVQKLAGPSLELDVEYGHSFTPDGGSRFHYLGAGVGLRLR